MRFQRENAVFKFLLCSVNGSFVFVFSIKLSWNIVQYVYFSGKDILSNPVAMKAIIK